MLDTLVRPDAGPAKSGQSECLEKERRKAWGLMRSRERHENWVRVFHVFLAFSREGLQRSGVRLVREEFARNVGPACREAAMHLSCLRGLLQLNVLPRGGDQGVIREMCSQRTEPRGERLPGPTLV